MANRCFRPILRLRKDPRGGARPAGTLRCGPAPWRPPASLGSEAAPPMLCAAPSTVDAAGRALCPAHAPLPPGPSPAGAAGAGSGHRARRRRPPSAPGRAVLPFALLRTQRRPGYEPQGAQSFGRALGGRDQTPVLFAGSPALSGTRRRVVSRR